LVTDNSLACPEFTLFGDEETPPRRIWSRGTSGILVVLVHLVFLAMLTFSVRLETAHPRSALETIFLLPSLEGRQAPDFHMVQPRQQNQTMPEVTTAPITLPKPPPPEEVQRPATPGDVLKAVGEELSCGAGSFEHLTQAERNRCRHEPWAANRGPAGTLVLAPASNIPKLNAPPQEFRMTGADAQRRAIETAPTGCPMMLNVPCLNNVPHDNN
jgi:hypothetical protein